MVTGRSRLLGAPGFYLAISNDRRIKIHATFHDLWNFREGEEAGVSSKNLKRALKNLETPFDTCQASCAQGLTDDI